jgi:predicted CoA-binding protein
MTGTSDRQQTIEYILGKAGVIAVVGLSSEKFKAGFYVPEYLQQEGYRIIPVNPYLDSALGEKAYPELAAVPDPIDLVLIFQRSENVPPFVDEAIEVGAKMVCMQLGIMNEKAAEKAETAGLKVVQNACMLVEHRRWK